MEHSPVRGTSRCAPGAFSLTAPVFRSSRAQKGAWCARDSTWATGPGAHGESTILRQARSQPHHQHQKPRANQTSSPGNITHQPASTTSPAPENRAPIKPAAPATLHTNQYQPAATAAPATKATHQPHHQHQKLRANQAGSPGNTTHQQHHQRHINRITNAKTAHQPRHQSWQNRISSNKSHAPTESPPSATPRANHLTSAACINASCTATGRRRTFP